MAPREQRIFPLVTDSILAPLIWTGVTIGILFGGTTTPTNPFIFYTLMAVVGIIIILGSDTETGQLKEALGFNAESYSGTNESIILVLLGLLGVGIVLATFPVIAGNAFVLFTGNQAVTQVFGLYPASVDAFASLYASLGSFGTGLLMFGYVAPVETFYIILTGKSSANWLYLNTGLGKTRSMLLAFFGIAPVLWASLHYFSWTLTLFSFPVFVFINSYFFLGYIFTDLIGIFSPENDLRVKDILSPSAITAHGGWNSLLSLNLIGAISISSLGISAIGVFITIASIAGLWVVAGRSPPVQEVTVSDIPGKP